MASWEETAIANSIPADTSWEAKARFLSTPARQQPGKNLAQALFPGAAADYQPKPAPTGFTPGGVGFPGPSQGQTMLSQADQQSMALPNDVMSLPQRGAGAIGSTMFPGMSGAQQPGFMNALGSNNTGLLKPLADISQNLINKSNARLNDPNRSAFLKPMDLALQNVGYMGKGGANLMQDPLTYLGLGGEAAGSGLIKAGTGVEDFGLKGVQASIKPSAALRNAPSPFNAENLFKKYDLAPEGFASKLGKDATLQKLSDFHSQLGDQAEQIVQGMPKINLGGAVSEARKTVQTALAKGGDRLTGISRRDKAELLNELDFWKNDVQDLTGNRFGWTDGNTAVEWRGSLANAAKYDQTASSNAKRTVAATIREELNKQIGNVSPEFRAIDKQFSETIPLRNAIADAVGKEGNKYPIGLRTAMMVANPASIPGELAKIALIEGTSRYAPSVAIKQLGEKMKSLGGSVSSGANTLQIPLRANNLLNQAGQ